METIDRAKRIKRIQNYILKMPSLSTTVTKVMEICNNPMSSPNDLNRIISLDPVLTGKVLKLINSAYYAQRNQVTSLTRAIIMLGLNTIKNLVLSSAVVESIGKKGTFQAFSMDEFWTHSIGVGVTARSIATLMDIPRVEREEYFVAGLLHDLGKIPLNNRFPEEYTHALKTITKRNIDLHQAEEVIFGINHCEVGRMIAEKWQLGETIIHALYYHHDHQNAPEEFQQVVTIVALANFYSDYYLIDDDDEEEAAPRPDPPIMLDLMREVGIGHAKLANIRNDMLKEIKNAKIFLNIS